MSEKLTASELVKLFAKRAGITQREAVRFVDAFQTVFEKALLEEKMVKVSGLGTFKLIEVEDRKSVNVATGETINIPGHSKLSFVPETQLRDRINLPLSHLESVVMDDYDASNDFLSADDIKDIEADLAEITKETVVSDGVDDENAPYSEEDDPIRKLAAEAMQLQGILAEIQSDMSFAEPQEESESKQTVEVIEEPEPVIEYIESEPVVESPIEAGQQQSQECNDEVLRMFQMAEAQLKKERRKRIFAVVAVLLVLCCGAVAVLYYLDILPSLFPKQRDAVVALAERPVAETFVSVDSTAGSSEVHSIDSVAVDTAVELVGASDTVLVTPEPIAIASVDLSPNSQLDKKREYTQFIDTIKLSSGNRLTLISRKYYGHKDYWVYIYEANRDVVSDPNNVPVGTMLKIPVLPSYLIDQGDPETIRYARYLHDIYVKK